MFSTGHRLIDFESLPVSPLVPITNQFLNQGVLISTDVGSPAQSTNDSTVTSPRQFPPQGQRALSNPGLNNVILTFNQPITRVGFEIRTNTNDDLNLTLKCLCTSGFQHTQFFTTNLTYRFVGMESTVPIKEVVIDVTQNVNGSMRVDNLRFEGPPVCDIASVIHETAAYDASCLGGSSISGPPNGPTQYLGSRFHVRETFQVSTVGGQLQGPLPQLGLGDQKIFAAIVALASPTALPVGGAPGEPFSPTELVAATTFHPGLGCNDARTPLTATLTPGDYALIFGAGDVPGFTTFDTTGDAAMVVSSLATVSDFIQWDGFSWIDNSFGPGFGHRYIVEGTTLFEEGAGPTTPVLLDAGRSRDVEGFPVNYQWSTDCPGGSIDTPTASTATLTLDSTAVCPDGVTCSVTLTVDDGNDSSAANPNCSTTSTISIDDTTEPLIGCPPDATGLACSADTSVGAQGTATASDAYGVASVASSDSTMHGCGNSQSITRTWTATDNCGNTSSCNQVISTADAGPPTITCPANATGLSCTADTSVAARGTATAHDDCGSATVGSTDTSEPGCGSTVSITRTWTATDECSNSASCDQLISTVDSTPPSVTCPPNATGLQCGADTSVAARGTATASDDCGAAAVSSSDAVTPGCGSTVSIARTWTGTDECSNSADCVQSISTVDTAPPTISVNSAPITVTDTNCSGSESVTLPAASATDACDGSVAVANDAPATFPAGATTTVQYQATDACGNPATANVSVTVRHGAHILASATRFVVGLGHHPGVSKQPVPGILIAAYDNSVGSCARQELNGHWGLLVLALPDIIANCTPVTTGTTNAAGEVLLDVPPGNYVVASHFDSDGDSDLDEYMGDRVQNLTCGETDRARLFTIVVSNGKKYCGKWHYFTGSELIIVEPEEVLWDGTEQLYPFVFDSVGDWGVTVSVAPPEGFVADYPQLSEDVTSEVEAVQFTITEVGSDLVPTQTEFRIRHKGRTQVLRSSIDIGLTAEYAKSRGFDPVQLESQGLIRQPAHAKPAVARGSIRSSR